MSQISIVANIPVDGITSTVRVKTNTPLDYKRIRSVVCEYAGVRNQLAFDDNATVGIKVAGAEILPNNFPARWISTGAQLKRNSQYSDLAIRKPFKWAELPMDEVASGSEIEITVTSSVSLMLIFKLDNKPVGGKRKRYCVSHHTRNSGWQQQPAEQQKSFDAAFEQKANLQIGGLFTGVFCDYDVNLGDLPFPWLQEGYKQVVARVPSVDKAQRIESIPPSDLLSLRQPIFVSRKHEELFMRQFLLDRTWVSLSSQDGTELVKHFNASVIAPTTTVSFKHAEFRKEGKSETLLATLHFPYFISWNDPTSAVLSDRLPFTEARLLLCLTYTENK